VLVPLAAANLSFPGCWAFSDMLEVGVPPGLHKDEVALTPAEARAHFGAWAVTSNPLVLGLDVRNDTLVTAHWDVIANTEALAVNAAWAGAPGTRVAGAPAAITWAPCGWSDLCSAPAWEVWYKPLPGGGGAVLVLNHNASSTAPVPVAVTFADLPGLACGRTVTGACAVRDVWHHADLGDFTATYTADVAAHDSVFLVLGAPAGGA
jgi:alpha-galactosidase